MVLRDASVEILLPEGVVKGGLRKDNSRSLDKGSSSDGWDAISSPRPHRKCWCRVPSLPSAARFTVVVQNLWVHAAFLVVVLIRVIKIRGILRKGKVFRSIHCCKPSLSFL